MNRAKDDHAVGAGLTVLFIPSARVKNPRRCYGSAGNKDDCIDACVLSDVVPTDQRQLCRDTAPITALRTIAQGRCDLVAPYFFTLSRPSSRATTWTAWSARRLVQGSDSVRRCVVGDRLWITRLHWQSNHSPAVVADALPVPAGQLNAASGVPVTTNQF